MTIWLMRLAYWIRKATNTPSEYVILIALPLKQWGARGGVAVKALQTCRSLVQFPMMSLEFFSDIILPVAL